MRARRFILQDHCFTHITFRCLNREFFLAATEMKTYVLETWKKYHARYGIKFIDWIIMENHVHVLAYIPSVTKLGNFMRLANSRIALRINQLIGRDSHALRERYKSPLISSLKQLTNTIGYIWLNRSRVGGISPEHDPFCSYYYRYNKIAHPLVPRYSEFGICDKNNETKFARQLLHYAKEQDLRESVYEHAHTIGDDTTVRHRRIEILKRMKIFKNNRATAPP